MYQGKLQERESRSLFQTRSPYAVDVWNTFRFAPALLDLDAKSGGRAHPSLYAMWNGRAAPYRLSPVGFRAPLTEPGVHLSLCTGLSIDVDAKSGGRAPS